MIGIRWRKGNGPVRGKTISKNAYTAFSACWEALVQVENGESNLEYRRAQ